MPVIVIAAVEIDVSVVSIPITCAGLSAELLWHRTGAPAPSSALLAAVFSAEPARPSLAEPVSRFGVEFEMKGRAQRAE